MNQFLLYLSLFFKIASFKAPPQDLPATNAALYSGVLLALAVRLLQYLIAGGTVYPIARVVLEVAVPGVALYILLLFFKLPNRFGQTFAAMSGSAAIVYALALPILPAFYSSASGPAYGPSVYLIILLDIWSIMVVAHILKHAINVGFATGISFAIALGLFALLLVESIAPTGSFESAAPQEISLDADLPFESVGE